MSSMVIWCAIDLVSCQSWYIYISCAEGSLDTNWLEVYALATTKLISGQGPTCDCALMSTSGKLATNIVAWYPAQSHYSHTELILPCYILLMPSAGLGSSNCQLVWLDQDFELPISDIFICTRPSWHPRLNPCGRSHVWNQWPTKVCLG